MLSLGGRWGQGLRAQGRAQGGGSAAHLQGDDADFPKDDSTSTECISPGTAPSTLENGWALPTLPPACRVWEAAMVCWPCSCNAHLCLSTCMPTHSQSIYWHSSVPNIVQWVVPPHQLVPPLLANPSSSRKPDLGDSDITLACMSVQAHQQRTGQ